MPSNYIPSSWASSRKAVIKCHPNSLAWCQLSILSRRKLRLPWYQHTWTKAPVHSAVGSDSDRKNKWNCGPRTRPWNDLTFSKKWNILRRLLNVRFQNLLRFHHSLSYQLDGTITLILLFTLALPKNVAIWVNLAIM